MSERRIHPEDWPDAIASVSGPQIVVGGPGTGKTEFLVRRVLHLVDELGIDPESVLVLSFGRRGVADLAARIRQGLRGSIGHIDITTFHSFAARILEAHHSSAGWQRNPQLLTGPEQVGLVADLLATDDPSRWSPAFRGLLSSKTFAREVTDFILRTGELTLSAADVASRGRADWKGVPEFVSRYDNELRRVGRIDYGTLLAQAVTLLTDPAVGPQVSRTTDYVLVDEYQDTTAAQALILDRLAPQGLTVTADPYQSIYSFRGASLRNVERFPTEFSKADGTPATRLVLTTSFRTPRAVLDAAVRIAGRDLPGAAGEVTPTPAEGAVDVFRFDQETEEAEWIASEIQRLHLAETLPYREMAVFVRSKRRFLGGLSRALTRRGVPHDLPDSRLSDQTAARFVLDLIAAATGHDGPAETSRAVRRLLLGPMFSTPLGLLRDIDRRRLDTGQPWGEVIRALAPHAGPLAEFLADTAWAVSLPAREGFWHVWSTLPQLRDVVLDEEREEERAAWASLGQVLERWSERNPEATLDDYARLTGDEDFEARPLLSYRKAGSDQLTVSTLHQAKGLEFEVVFIADAVEGVFPDLRSRDTLLGVRHLLPDLPTDTGAYQAFRLQEERRLAYTAMTRARRRVVWTATSTGFEEGRGIPSRFLALVAGTATVEEAAFRPDRRATPVTPQEAESALRHILTDPAKPAPTRLAALSILTQRPNPRLRAVTEFAGNRKRGPDHGLVPPDLVLSPSAAEAYELCPRRYAVERRLGVGDETNIYAAFGLLIHDVLEATERAAVDRGDTHGTLDYAIAELESRLEPATFGGRLFATAWYRRGAEALTRLYANWPSDGQPVALEHTLSLTVSDTDWTGRADRIEARNGELFVVDYKTTRNPPKHAVMAESLQLGFYVLAAAADEDLATYGTPGGAEAWYPANRTQATSIRSFEMGNVAEVEARLGDVADGIASETWTERPGIHCDRCRVRSLCPSWPEGQEAFT